MWQRLFRKKIRPVPEKKVERIQWLIHFTVFSLKQIIQIEGRAPRWEAGFGQPHRGARHGFPHALEGRILLVAPAAGAWGEGGIKQGRPGGGGESPQSGKTPKDCTCDKTQR